MRRWVSTVALILAASPAVAVTTTADAADTVTIEVAEAPAQPPSAPGLYVRSYGHSATVAWDAVSDNGSPITAQLMTHYAAPVASPVTDDPGPAATSHTSFGLGDTASLPINIALRHTLIASNAAGDSEPATLELGLTGRDSMVQVTEETRGLDSVDLSWDRMVRSSPIHV